jgi:hypothetical protein
MWDEVSNKKNNLYNESIKVLNSINQISNTFFLLKKRSEKTRLIKKTLTILGHKLGYKVYANGLTEEDKLEIGNNFVNKEWLFDLQWYTEPDNIYKKNKGYKTLSFPMVLECEWDIKRKNEKIENDYSAMKYDFQKLICTNAKLQIMIFKLLDTKHEVNIDNHIDSLLSMYENRTLSSIVLIIGFNWKMKKVYYREINLTIALT